MIRAGFVLAGGQSSRMGRDKALLDTGGATLLDHVARQVEIATGSATVVAPPARYPHCRWPLIADLREGCGPLAGIEAALVRGGQLGARWNLVVAVDMPGVRHEFLERLLRAAEQYQADCVLPESAPGRLEPLCAVYGHRCAEAARRALDSGVRKVTEAWTSLQVVHFPIDNQEYVANVNTPPEWTGYLERRRG